MKLLHYQTVRKKMKKTIRWRIVFWVGMWGYNLQYQEKWYKFKTEDDKMYLFVEFQTDKYSPFNYLHFKIIELKKEISVKEYHSFFLILISKYSEKLS